LGQEWGSGSGRRQDVISGEAIFGRFMKLLAGCAGPIMAAAMVFAPLAPALADDPIGALITQQGLESPRSALPVALSMTLSEAPGLSRFTIEVSDPVKLRVFTLTGPDRVVIDMPEMLWRLSSEARPSGRGLVKSYRYGLFRKGDSRFVIDLNGPVAIVPAQLLPPENGKAFRLVIDLEPTNAQAFAASAGWPADAGPGEMAATPGPALAKRGKKIIVVDAGHGGIDPGTHGESGLEEKDVVLAVAKDLRRALEATGRYTVKLTRNSDVFIPLRERVAMARADRGDLFLSLHADSNERRAVRGASVYTLSEDASDREAALLADKENMSDVIAGVDLSDEESPVASILIDLAQRDTMNRSIRFAETVLDALATATLVRPTTPHRAAGFAVLKAPDIPSVLIELGYLTNQQDESEMRTAAWRTQVAQAIARAVERHFGAETAPLGRQAAE
jgi:N-acetylmuramoyl-L-alanine amidase